MKRHNVKFRIEDESQVNLYFSHLALVLDLIQLFFLSHTFSVSFQAFLLKREEEIPHLIKLNHTVKITIDTGSVLPGPTAI